MSPRSGRSGAAAPDRALADAAALRRARDAIERDGWAAATMERLATALGVSRMTLHRRGVRREHVLHALGGLLEDEYRRALWPALTAPGSGRERLAQALGALCVVTEENLALLAALDSAERDAIFHDEGAEVLTQAVFTEPLQALLREGVADGTLALDGGAVAPAADAPADDARAEGTPPSTSAAAPEDELSETATVLFNLVGWTYRHLRLAHGWPPARTAAAVTRRAVRSVAA